MEIYLAGGVRAAGNRVYLEIVAEILEDAGHQVFLPHRDGSLPGKSGRQRGLITKADAFNMSRGIFEYNLEVIRSSNAVVAVLDGLCWGTTVELGYAYAYKTLAQRQFAIVGIFTDPINELDLMRHHACDEVIADLEKLPETLDRCLASTTNAVGQDHLPRRSLRTTTAVKTG